MNQEIDLCPGCGKNEIAYDDKGVRLCQECFDKNPAAQKRWNSIDPAYDSLYGDA